MIMMNIIEKLGGYDNAKKLRGTTSNALLDMKTWQVHVDDIDEALLEYRREHNIFEVGDKVVFVSEKMDFLDDDQIHSISVITENNLPKVCGIYVLFEAVKHATDEEIKAGHRL